MAPLSVKLPLSAISVYFLLFYLTTKTVIGQDDLCTPNPCGENRRCYTSFSGDTLAIACDCLIGHHVPEGGDPFDGCVADDEAEASPPPPPPSFSPSTTTTTVAPPAPTFGTIFRESLASSPPPPATPPPSTPPPSPPRLQAGHRPSQLIPRKFGGSGQAVANFVDVDDKDSFPEECLVHEDCEDHEFCNKEKCVDACTALENVCGTGALCVATIHRPVCVCPDGFEGSPYDKCTEIPSRVGMKFRKRYILKKQKMKDTKSSLSIYPRPFQSNRQHKKFPLSKYDLWFGPSLNSKPNHPTGHHSPNANEIAPRFYPSYPPPIPLWDLMISKYRRKFRPYFPTRSTTTTRRPWTATTTRRPWTTTTTRRPWTTTTTRRPWTGPTCRPIPSYCDDLPPKLDRPLDCVVICVLPRRSP